MKTLTKLKRRAYLTRHLEDMSGCLAMLTIHNGKESEKRQLAHNIIHLRQMIKEEVRS